MLPDSVVLRVKSPERISPGSFCLSGRFDNLGPVASDDPRTRVSFKMNISGQSEKAHLICVKIRCFNDYFPPAGKPAFASRNKIAADISLVPALVMFIETLKSEDQTMATQTLKLNVKTGEKDGKNFWDRCGVAFVHTDDHGNITSIQVKHNMFPGVEMVAFPKRNDDEQN